LPTDRPSRTCLFSEVLGGLENTVILYTSRFNCVELTVFFIINDSHMLNIWTTSIEADLYTRKRNKK